jgi:hypothetical protein
MREFTPEQEKVRATVIKYVDEAYRASVSTRVPSLRGEICKHVKDKLGIPCYPDKLQPCFPPELDGSGPLMKRICRASAVRYPKERVGLTKKAIRRRKKKLAARAKGGVHAPTGSVAADKATAYEEPKELGILETIERSLKMDRAQTAIRRDVAKEVAKSVRILCSHPDEKVSGPVLEALGEELPRILKHRYGVTATLPELISMQKTYDKATKEGWRVEDVSEWAAQSEEEQEAFKELREKAYDEGLLVNEYIEGLKAKSG